MSKRWTSRRSKRPSPPSLPNRARSGPQADEAQLLADAGAVSSVGKIEILVRVGACAHAFDLVGRDSGGLELGADAGDEIHVRPRVPRPRDEAIVEFCGDLLADLEGVELDARADRREQIPGIGPRRD